jgi:hypothetical protein
MRSDGGSASGVLSKQLTDDALNDVSTLGKAAIANLPVDLGDASLPQSHLDNDHANLKEAFTPLNYEYENIDGLIDELSTRLDRHVSDFEDNVGAKTEIISNAQELRNHTTFSYSAERYESSNPSGVDSEGRTLRQNQVTLARKGLREAWSKGNIRQCNAHCLAVRGRWSHWSNSDEWNQTCYNGCRTEQRNRDRSSPKTWMTLSQCLKRALPYNNSVAASRRCKLYIGMSLSNHKQALRVCLQRKMTSDEYCHRQFGRPFN